MGRVIVAGSVNMDLIVDVERLPEPGETTIGTGLRRLPGGKGGNQAHAAARVASPDVGVAFVGAVGDDEVGPVLRDGLAAAGVRVGALGTVPGPSGLAIIEVDAKGENRIVVVPGANAAWTADQIESVAPGPGDVVVLQLEVPADVVAGVADRARAAGARVVLNAAPAHPRAGELAALADLVVVNEIEAVHLLGIDGPPDEAALAAARSRLAADLVVTLGADGALVSRADGGAARIPASPVDAVDTVGAGDAFVGGLAAALAEGASLDDAVRIGAAAGALTATVRGARHPGLTRTAVLELLGMPGGDGD